MKTNLFIPAKIRVGFQNRTDTFTGKLAYIIYYDENNKIRKETSWNTWCDKEITSLEIDNTPRGGYIFNKGVKRDGYWGSGRSVIRIYDPRDFEFEIDVDNMIGLLMHSDVSKRDIEQPCVFAWAAGNLVLLPVNSVEYKESLEYTAKQSLKVSARDLVKGTQYAQKKSDDILMYLGYYIWYEWSYQGNCGWKSQCLKGKKHIFVDDRGNFQPKIVSTLSQQVSTDINQDYANILDKFITSSNSQLVVDLRIQSPMDTNVVPTKECLYHIDNSKLISYISCDWNTYNKEDVDLGNYNSYGYSGGSWHNQIKTHKTEMGGVAFEFTSMIHRDWHTAQTPKTLDGKIKTYITAKGITGKISAKKYRDLIIEYGCGEMILTLEDGTESTEQIL